MANKRKRKRKLKPFTKVLLILIPCFAIVGIVYGIDSNRVNDNKTTDVKLDIKTNDNVVNDSNEVTGNTTDDNGSVDEVEVNPDDIYGILENIAKKDYRYKEVLANKDIYPEKLLEMLSRNKDMISYMYDFGDKKGHVYIDNIGKVTKGEYPLLLQYDKKWGYGIYGDNVIAVNGCGPTSLAMVVAGLTGKNDTTPYDIAKYSYEKGYYTEEWGTKWDLMSTGVEPFGVTGKKIVLSKQNLYNELNSGHPLVASMRPGDFTTVGHFIVLTGIKDDKIVVNDPNSKERSAKLWEYDVIAPQIKGLWTYSLIN